jgi:hypothetical protein
MFVGGAEASQKGFGDLMPAKLTLRSAIALLHQNKGHEFSKLSLLKFPGGWTAPHVNDAALTLAFNRAS